MAKKKMEEEFTIDSEAIEQQTKVQTPAVQELVQQKVSKVKKVERHESDDMINPLRKEIITVKFIPQQGMISDPKHVLYGGLSERSFIHVTVPKLRSGVFVNVLTDSEKEYLEAALGLESGAMNVYNKVDNFWSNATEGGMSGVRLGKIDTRLDLSDPMDYIRYKILLANKDIVAPDLQTLQD